MQTSALFIGLLTLAVGDSAERVKVTVAVSTLDHFKESEYLDLLKAGVSHIIFSQNWLLFDGSIHFPGEWVNASFVRNIRSHAAQYNATVSIGVVPQPFLNNDSRSFSDYEAKAQATIKEYDVDGLVFEVWENSFTPERNQWPVLNNVSKITRSKFITSRGTRVSSSLMFGGRLSTTDMWKDMVVNRPWRYTDLNYCVLDTDDLDYKTQITTDWTRNLTSRLMQHLLDKSTLSFAIIPEARNKTSSDSYAHLVSIGAPVSGDGLFNGLYYNSQKQVEDKINFTRSSRLHGFAELFPFLDLPVINESSLLHAALG